MLPVCPKRGSVPKRVDMSGSIDSENRHRILHTPQNCFHLSSTHLGNLLLVQVEFAAFFRFSKLSAVCMQLCSLKYNNFLSLSKGGC